MVTVLVARIIFLFFIPLITGGKRYRYGRECAWLEIVWTILPAGVLIFLSSFSLANLYAIEIGEQVDYQRKVTGHQ